VTDSILPPNATALERALDDVMGSRPIPVPVRDVWDAWTCPAPLLPWLAWALSVDNWDPEWGEQKKRGTIAASVAVHRAKGTPDAMRRALAALGLRLEIVEWWQETPRGDPYTFRIAVTVIDGTAQQAEMRRILEVVEAAKNLRSHLSSIDVAVESNSAFYMAGVTGIGNEITVYPEL